MGRQKKQPPKDESKKPEAPQQLEESASGAQQPSPAKKRSPRIGPVRYAALPVDLYEFLERYAESESEPYDQKSIAWALRRAVAFFKSHVEKERSEGQSGS